MKPTAATPGCEICADDEHRARRESRARWLTKIGGLVLASIPVALALARFSGRPLRAGLVAGDGEPYLFELALGWIPIALTIGLGLLVASLFAGPGAPRRATAIDKRPARGEDDLAAAAFRAPTFAPVPRLCPHHLRRAKGDDDSRFVLDD